MRLKRALFVPSVYRPRRPQASPLWQIVHHAWNDFLAGDWFRERLDLPDGQLAATAAVQTFGDYLVFHPHAHVLAATGLYDREGRFHEFPLESLDPPRRTLPLPIHRGAPSRETHSEKKARELLNWKHSGFSLDAGDQPVHSAAGRQRLAEYLLRAPFSLEKITWVEKTRRVIYRSSRSWRTIPCTPHGWPEP